MKFNKFIHVTLTFGLLLFLSVKGLASNEPIGEMLKRARAQFYVAVEDEKQIAPTIRLFERIEQIEPKYTGRIQVYIGALVALKGKHAFFPHTKLKWVKRGLAIMDNGLQKTPNDLEALFIHGSTCYYLPFFFRRGDDAQRDFRKIIKLMPHQMDTYDPKLITNVVAFLLENARLTDGEKAYLQMLKGKLKSQDPVNHQ